MDSSGVKISPVTLMPIEIDREEKIKDAISQKDMSLHSAAEWLDISKTDAGKKLTAKIEELLAARIRRFVNEDAESKAYVNVLKSIGVAEGLARNAVHELMDRELRTAHRAD